MDSSNQPHQILKQLDIKPIFTIFHFNDVYDIQAKKGKGGICNFKAKLQELRQTHGQNSICLFSGDAFSPSILSRAKKGWQMVKALNSLKIDGACYGNHEFDFQQEHSIKLAQACNFPWLLGNIKHIQTGRILGNGIPYITHSTNNLKIGIFGVAGQDWISIMSQQYQGLFECLNVQTYCTQMSLKLKHQQKCDFIIALTHMRNGADLDLAQVPTDIDIILGGHDHVIMNRCIEKTPVVKSGSNFHQIGVIQVYPQIAQNQAQKIDHFFEQPLNQPTQLWQRLYLGKNYNFSCQVQDVPTAPPQKIDLELKAHVDLEMDEYMKFDKVVGYADCPLEARFKVIRTQESNYGNFFADVFRLYYGSDMAFLNSGCIRNDIIMPQGNIKFSKLTNIIDDAVIVKSIPGPMVYRMLQYAVIGLPHSFMGSFLLVSGIKYKYDLTKTPRIQEVQFQGQLLDLNRQYSIAMPSYMGNGADGYDFIKPFNKIVDQVRATSIMTMLLKFFQGLDQKLESHEVNHDYHYHPNRSAFHRLQRINALRSRFLDTQNGERLVCINPQKDNRIICLNNQHK